MNLDRLYPYGFRSTLFDRLIPESEDYAKGLSIQQLRESVAKDLEDLLNSRVAKLDHVVDDYPLVKNLYFSSVLLILWAFLQPIR